MSSNVARLFVDRRSNGDLQSDTVEYEESIDEDQDWVPRLRYAAAEHRCDEDYESGDPEQGLNGRNFNFHSNRRNLNDEKETENDQAIDEKEDVVDCESNAREVGQEAHRRRF